MKIKTSELSGVALDWAVGECEQDPTYRTRNYSTDWSFSGPIIEREKITLLEQDPVWVASCSNEEGAFLEEGENMLETAMRCYVASKLGDEVDVPEELLT